MPRYDFSSQRLFVDSDLTEGRSLELDRNQANYLLSVLRKNTSDHVLVFNGRDGEWHADVIPEGRKKASLALRERVREQPNPRDLHYLFAPLKQARLEYMVQKAVEMGASVLQPVTTQFTQVHTLKLDRMRAHTIEAAEQCGILAIPELSEPVSLDQMLADFSPDRHLILCDEGEETQNPLTALENVAPAPLSVLVGPEGGFSEEERVKLRAHPQTIPIPLGPRVLRADTAAVAALAIVQARLGDWQDC